MTYFVREVVVTRRSAVRPPLSARGTIAGALGTPAVTEETLNQISFQSNESKTQFTLKQLFRNTLPSSLSHTRAPRRRSPLVSHRSLSFNTVLLRFV